MNASERIEKLLRLMDSSNENEASLALIKLKEALAKEHLKIGDLADTIKRKTPVVPPPPQPPDTRPHQGANWYDVSDPHHTEMAAYCKAFRHRMRQKDKDFIDSIWKWMEKGRALSPKQVEWLRDLRERCQRMKGYT